MSSQAEELRAGGWSGSGAVSALHDELLKKGNYFRLVPNRSHNKDCIKDCIEETKREVYVVHGSLSNSCTIRLCDAPVSDTGAASDIVRHMNLDCRPALYVHEPGSRILTLALRRWIADYNSEISVHCRFSCAPVKPARCSE
jgi:hypothetical protein